MEMTVEPIGEGVVRVALRGRLDTPGVDFAGSMTIRMFMTIARALARKGGRIALCSPAWRKSSTWSNATRSCRWPPTWPLRSSASAPERRTHGSRCQSESDSIDRSPLMGSDGGALRERAGLRFDSLSPTVRNGYPQTGVAGPFGGVRRGVPMPANSSISPQ